MRFLRSRVEQLADYLRDRIQHGELKDPLPNIRDWSTRLGVGHVTLEQALRILARENLLVIQPRKGVKLNATVRARSSGERVKLVRWLYIGKEFRDISFMADLFVAISERLREYDIPLVTDRCDMRRLRELQKRGESPNEMLVLANFQERYQRILAGFQRSALLIALPAPGISFPFVWNDAEGAIVHAVRELAGRGFTRLCMFLGGQRRVGPTDRLFLQACAELNPAVHGELERLASDPTEQQLGAQRWAARVRGRLGVLAVYPTPATVLISALQQASIKVPDQVEVVGINTMWHSVRVVPRPVHYPFPVEAFARVVVRAAREYFARGTVPRLKKVIPLEVVRPR